MTIIIACHKLPENLRELSPLVGQKDGIRMVLIHADVDGFQFISREQASEILTEEVLIAAENLPPQEVLLPDTGI